MSGVKKILLFHLHSNGDCLYATSVARQIKTDYPGCHLTWAVASFSKSILENNPYIDKIWEIPGVDKTNSSRIHRRLKKEVLKQKKQGIYDEVYFTQLIDDNLANYDGCIRSGIFRGYDRPITVPITPVLRLREEELEKTKRFASEHNLAGYKTVILFEYAPQSGQLALTTEIALDIARKLTEDGTTAIILSSANKINEPNKAIIDGSELTLRETVALTHHCTLLLGCSSGISWASTSEAGKMLPMVQLIDPYSPWVNPMSRDFERFGLPSDKLIELYDNVDDKLINCIDDVLSQGFDFARKKYYSTLPLHFLGTSRAIYNMLCFLQFGAIVRHIRINVGVFGWHPLLIRAIVTGFVTAPFNLVSNLVRKNILKKR